LGGGGPHDDGLGGKGYGRRGDAPAAGFDRLRPRGWSAPLLCLSGHAGWHSAKRSCGTSSTAISTQPRVCDSYEAILDACCGAWNALIAQSEVIA